MLETQTAAAGPLPSLFLEAFKSCRRRRRSRKVKECQFSDQAYLGKFWKCLSLTKRPRKALSSVFRILGGRAPHFPRSRNYQNNTVVIKLRVSDIHCLKPCSRKFVVHRNSESSQHPDLPRSERISDRTNTKSIDGSAIDTTTSS